LSQRRRTRNNVEKTERDPIMKTGGLSGSGGSPIKCVTIPVMALVAMKKIPIMLSTQRGASLGARLVPRTVWRYLLAGKVGPTRR
jgi:hypothetical protein